MDRSKRAVELADAKGVLAYHESVLPGSELPPPPFAAVLLEVVEHNNSGMDILKHIADSADIILASVPYMEPKGVNEYHRLFNLSEIDFDWMTPKAAFFRPEKYPYTLLIEWRQHGT